MGQPVFPDGQSKHGHRQQHQNGNEEKQGGVILAPRGVARDQQARGGQGKDAAQRAHEVDDGVALAAQGLGGDIRHERHGGRAVDAHGQEQKRQRAHKQPKAPRPVGGGQEVHQHRRGQRAAHDVGHALAKRRARAVGELAEKRQQKQRQDVVQRHDDARDIIGHIEGVFQNQGYDAVVELPERADGEKCQAHQQRSLVVELHPFDLP